MKEFVGTTSFFSLHCILHQEFVALLGEIESEYGEITVRWLSCGSVLQRFLDLLKEIKLFLEKKNKRIEQDDEGWIRDLTFLVDATGHLNTLNKELQGKDKLITEMFDSIKAFRAKLRLWENRLQVHNLVHFLHLKS
jgi:glutaredoxin-related protein